MATTPLHEIKTIGMPEAFTRIRHLLPGFSYRAERDRDLMLARNAAVHLGEVPEELVPRVIYSMVRIHTELGQAIGDWGEGETFLEDYWDDRVDTVRHLLDESLADSERIARAKVATAELNFLRTYGRLDEEQRRTTAQLLAGRRAWAAPVESEVECPACGQFGVLAFDGVDLGEPFDAPLWSTGEPARYVHQREQALGFDCSACGLSLEGDQAAGAGLTWQIEMPDRLVSDEHPPGSAEQ